MITCRTLGPFEISVNGAPAPAELTWRKHLGLLIYLARSPKLRRGRDHLITLFWQEKPEDAARHSLNQALRVLRRSAGDEGLLSEGGQVRLHPNAVQLDTDRLVERMEQEDWSGAAALVGGVFLEGFSIPESSEFEDWLAAERRAWAFRSIQAITASGEILLGTGHADQAVALGELGLRVDPLSEAAVRLVMRGLALSGNRTAALATHESFAAKMREDAGVTPGTELETLAACLRQDRARQPSPPRTEPRRASRPAPLIGRERELTQLIEAWHKCKAQKRTSVAVIQGDSGMGKTRLLEELVLRASMDGAAIASARAVEADLAQPCAALVALARGGMLNFRGLAGVPPAALGTIAEQSEEWRERFPHATPASGGHSLPRALAEMLRVTLEEHPVVLALDDAQWVDRESLLGLTGILRDLPGCPVLVLLGAAPHPPRPELDAIAAAIGREIGGIQLRLEPWKAEEIQAVARWWLPTYSASDIERVSRRVAFDSAGLPLLVVEIFRAIALGLELPHEQPWPRPFHTLDQTLPSDLPGAVTASIRVAFRRLSSDAQRILAAASVLGDRVLPVRLVSGTGLTIEAVDEALDELEWHRWMVSEARGYSFVARLVRDIVANDMLTAGQRRRILETA